MGSQPMAGCTQIKLCNLTTIPQRRLQKLQRHKAPSYKKMAGAMTYRKEGSNLVVQLISCMSILSLALLNIHNRLKSRDNVPTAWKPC